MKIQEFTKRPVQVSAVRLTNAEAMQNAAKWCGGRYNGEGKASDPTDITHWVDIPTLEGTMRASKGDYIIRGVQGEFYPCRPDIFEATYEEVTE